jgi:Phage tail sheath C-terminal domain
LTWLLNNNGSLLIRHYKTTNPANTLVSEPTSTTIADYVAQQFRSNLQQFIGRKLVDSLVTDITVVCNSLLKNLVDLQIISGYQQLSVEQNASDPTEVDVTVTFQPIFSLLYLSVTFTVTTTG